MKKSLLLIPVLAVLAAVAHAEEESLLDKAARAAKKAGEATERGIEKGASSAGQGIDKGFGAANEKVLKPADKWLQEKAARPGAGESKPEKSY